MLYDQMFSRQLYVSGPPALHSSSSTSTLQRRCFFKSKELIDLRAYHMSDPVVMDTQQTFAA